MKSAQISSMKATTCLATLTQSPIIILVKDVEEAVEKGRQLINKRGNKKLLGNVFFSSKAFNELSRFLMKLKGHLIEDSKAVVPVSVDASKPLDDKQLFELATILLDQSFGDSDDKVIFPSLLNLQAAFRFSRLSAMARLYLHKCFTFEFFMAVCEINIYYAETVARILSSNLNYQFALYQGVDVLSDKKSSQIAASILPNINDFFLFLFGNEQEQQQAIEFFTGLHQYHSLILQWISNDVRQFMMYVLSIDAKDLKKVFETLGYMHKMDVLDQDCKDFSAKHPENAFAVSRAIVWLKDHKINTPENRSSVFSHASIAGYLSNVGVPQVKEQEVHLNQAIFQLTLEKAKEKQQFIGSFFAPATAAPADQKEEASSHVASIVMGYLH